MNNDNIDVNKPSNTYTPSNEVTDNNDPHAPNGLPPENQDNVQPPVDPIVNFLAHIQIGDEILHELAECSWNQEKYAKYFKATDLFIINAMIGEVNAWEEHDPNDPNYKAFNNLMKWFMYLIAVNPWWHRKLCYYNRMMGTNTAADTYWHIQYHPAYVPGLKNFYTDNLNKSKTEFNDECIDRIELYSWIDAATEQDTEVKIVKRKTMRNPTKPKKKTTINKSDE